MSKNKYALFMLLPFLVSAFIVERGQAQNTLRGGSADSTVITSDSLVIKGTVISAQDSISIPGVNIKVQGKKIGTVTNNQGKYSIRVPKSAEVLIFSYVGYKTEEIPINGRTVINVKLEKKVEDLKELVVLGYGSVYRKDLTGAVASISQAELKRQTATSPAQLLQGRVAGVRVIKNSGAPGGGATVRIRGVNSIRAGNSPLYVIDGVPISGGSSPSQSPLSLINPQDIVSIEVLKDASATAIYGSRGANGVILITTKQGGGPTRVNLNVSYGTSQVRNKIDLLNTRQYIELANEAAVNNGKSPIFTEPASSYPNTDWQEEIFRVAPRQNYQLSVTGGNKNTQYAISANYLNEKGIVIGSEFNRYSFRVNFDKQIDDNFRIGNNLTLSYATYNLVKTGGRGLSGIVSGALQLAPVKPVKDENGNYVFQTEHTIERPNPVASALEKTDTNDRFKILGNVFAEYEFTDHLIARVSIGGNMSYVKHNFYAPKTTLEGQQRNSVGLVRTRKKIRWINENTLTYKNTFADQHNLTVLAGFTLEHTTREGLKGESAGFVTDAYKFNNLAAGENPSNPSTGAAEAALASYIARVNYNFDNRYYLTLTGRIDGSSRFGKKNRYGFFPSAALAWRVSNESFMQQQDVISNLKLRLSYGITGNQAIDNFLYLTRLGFSQVTLGDQVLIGINPARIGNESLKWEQTSQANIGLDIGFFNGRINFTGNIYHKKTTDLLLRRRVSRYTGYSSYLDNIGSTQNRGIELALETKNIVSKNFTWSTSINFSMNKNEVLELAGDEPLFVGTPISFASGQSFRIIKEGKSLGAFYGYVYGGVYNDQQEINNTPYAAESAQPGDPYLVDISGPKGKPDGEISSYDRTIIGNAFPDFTFGVSNTFYFKNFDLSVFIQGVYGNEIMNMNTFRLESIRGYTNQTTDVLNRWTPQNKNTNIPRADRSRSSAGQLAMRAISTRLIEDGSYLRVKNVTLGYTLPAQVVESVGIRSLRIYFTATNLFTLTNYSGYDPEVSTYNNLGSIGADYGTYPTSKTYLFGINLGF